MYSHSESHFTESHIYLSTYMQLNQQAHTHTHTHTHTSKSASLCSMCWCKHLPVSSVHLCVCVCVCVCVCISPAFEQSALTPHISSLCQSLSPKLQSLLSLRNVTFFSVKFTFTVESLLFSPCCSTSLKIKLTHSASLLCRRSYKSGLSLFEREEKRAREQQRGLWVRRESGVSPAESPLDRPQGSNLLRRQVNQSGGSQLNGAHIQRRTWVETENTAVSQCGLCMPLTEKGQHPTETRTHYAS